MSAILRFGDCQFDTDRRELQRSGAARHLTPKALQLLVLLLRARPRAVTKSEIQAVLWPDTFVSDGSISVLLAELRRALGDPARASRYLRTIHSFGVAFCAEVSVGEGPTGPPLCRLVAWGLNQYSLGAGPSLIGRDPECTVRIDVASVSRRHARIHVAPGTAVLEDLESRNGSRVNGEPVTGARELAEGDDIRLGAVALSFHWVPEPIARETIPLELANAANP
jgi:DNA-binding winged helix-turn-helix (wHTH) protein